LQDFRCIKGIYDLKDSELLFATIVPDKKLKHHQTASYHQTAQGAVTNLDFCGANQKR